MRKLLASAPLLVLLLLLPACTTVSGKTAGERVDDTLTTAAVKARLAGDKMATLTRIDVDTNQGVVTLNGTADTEQARIRAGDLARGVSGVRAVVNNLRVAAAAPTESDVSRRPVPSSAGAGTGRWRAVDASLEGSPTEIRTRAAREAALQNRTVAYESADGFQRIEAHPMTTVGPNGCRQVQERVFQNGQLVDDRPTEVCR